MYRIGFERSNVPVFHRVTRQRYNYYVEKAIDVHMLAPMPDTQMMNIHCLIPRRLLTNPELNLSLKLLEREVYEYYLYSLRKGIGKPANAHDVLLAPKHYFTEFEAAFTLTRVRGRVIVNTSLHVFQ